MSTTVAALWRYPVKSMSGERLMQAEVTPDGFSGDREYAFESSGAPPGMLRVTGGERRELLRFEAFTREGRTLVRSPSGLVFPVASLLLLDHLPNTNTLKLTRSPTPQTDCRLIALISNQTIHQLPLELGKTLDPRRFRANLYLDTTEPFAEDRLVGETVALGSAVLSITERDPRRRFITLDPDTTEPLPTLMKLLDRFHQGRAGVYASVISPGAIRFGDLCGAAKVA